jgi:hypothetical protein
MSTIAPNGSIQGRVRKWMCPFVGALRTPQSQSSKETGRNNSVFRYFVVDSISTHGIAFSRAFLMKRERNDGNTNRAARLCSGSSHREQACLAPRHPEALGRSFRSSILQLGRSRSIPRRDDGEAHAILHGFSAVGWMGIRDLLGRSHPAILATSTATE